MTDPKPFNLAAALPGWRWLYDVRRQTVTALHPSGLHFEVSTDSFGAIASDVAAVIAEALGDALEARMTGLVTIEVARSQQGTHTVMVKRLDSTLRYAGVADGR